ncbi:MAG: dienelactone hydrolase family protein [SAR202 cluster bacterium]|nr:dienelactone hydrolase family protein [SAR202 cluster bacterium]
MPASWVDIKVGRQTMEGYLTQPEAQGRYPAVLVIQEIWGVNSHIQSVTERFPSKGYVGLAPAMFHREGRMTIGLHEEFDTALARLGRCTDANIVADVQAAVDYLKAQPFVLPDRIGIVGFCFGGRVSYLAACSVKDLKASVVYYGGRILQPLGGTGPAPIEQTSKITVPILGMFGEDDQNPTPTDVGRIQGELTQHHKTHEFHMYPGCGHGFHCDARPSYRPEAARDAWTKTMAWFDKYLKG